MSYVKASLRPCAAKLVLETLVSRLENPSVHVSADSDTLLMVTVAVVTADIELSGCWVRCDGSRSGCTSDASAMKVNFQILKSNLHSSKRVGKAAK